MLEDTLSRLEAAKLRWMTGGEADVRSDPFTSGTQGVEAHAAFGTGGAVPPNLSAALCTQQAHDGRAAARAAVAAVIHAFAPGLPPHHATTRPKHLAGPHRTDGREGRHGAPV